MKTVMHIISGLQDGGAEAVLHRLLLTDHKHEHVVVSMSGMGKYGSIFQEMGVKVETLGMTKSVRSMFSVFRLFRIIRSYKPDVVQTWMYHADFLGGCIARLARVPRVVWGIHHTTFDELSVNSLTRLIVRLNAHLSKFVPHAIISCSTRGVDVHISAGFSADKLIAIPNGHDISTFRRDSALRAEFREMTNIAQEEHVIGFVGRYNPQKDIPNLVKTLGHLKKAKVPFTAVLVGGKFDSSNEELMSLIDAADIRDVVVLKGQQNRIEMIMNGFDLLVLSSAFGEAFPNVICEAMACGVPCVATDLGDCKQIIGDTGEIVPPRDAEKLSEAIQKMLADLPDEDQANRISARISDNFSIEKMVEKYSEVWNA